MSLSSCLLKKFHSFVEHPNHSIEDAKGYFGRSAKKIYSTLKKYKYYAYRILPVQTLSEEQRNNRVAFCQEMLVLKGDDNNFFKKVLWTDECTFTTAGIYNRKNVRFWSTTNPRIIREIKFQGRQSLHVWCGILNDQVIGPIFYNGNLSGAKYLEMLIN